jgi:hypothetical protein
VDQTEKGWFITYIDRDPEALERQKVRTYNFFEILISNNLYCNLATSCYLKK